MPMPSLVKYFAFVGAGLFAILSLVNFLLDPSTGATTVASAPAKRTIVVQHDPRASKVERWRDEQAALKAAEQNQTSQNASPARPTSGPARPAAAVQAAVPASQPAPQAQPQPAPQIAAATGAPEPAEPQPAAAPGPDTSTMVGVETTDERAAKAAERKAKIAKAKARKERLARERERALAAQGYPRTASNSQDQYYYGQRGQQFTTRSAFAQQPSFGPFGFGWGRGW
jgi:hypothetical protein